VTQFYKLVTIERVDQPSDFEDQELKKEKKMMEPFYNICALHVHSSQMAINL